MATVDGATVGEYMTRNVDTVAPTDSVGTVAARIAESDEHSGYPVCESGQVRGFVTASDLLLQPDDAPIASVMSDDLLVAHPKMAVDDAARVILRSGIRKLPVVDDEDQLVGIISNADVVRSQIERATPDKVEKLMRTLESLHDVAVSQERRSVSLEALRPTQRKVYADELDGRRYELERGLAEPLVVIANGDDLVLADGHHRVKAADSLGIDRMDAYVIVLATPVDLGMVETAVAEELYSIDDITVVDYARHPLVRQTRRLRD